MHYINCRGIKLVHYTMIALEIGMEPLGNGLTLRQPPCNNSYQWGISSPNAIHVSQLSPFLFTA